MLRLIICLWLIIKAEVLFSQNECVYTNQINLNSGVNYAEGGFVQEGQFDQHWMLSNVSNVPFAVKDVMATVITPIGSYIQTGFSKWISFAQSPAYYTTNSTDGFYTLTFKYTFNTIAADYLNFDLNFAFDNYISDIKIDGTTIGFSQIASPNPSYYKTLTSLKYSNFYIGGNHSLEFNVVNYHVPSLLNPHAFNIYGSIQSQTHSLIKNGSNLDALHLYIPNAFSPNLDGKNDCFRINHHEPFNKFYFKIYNRWGQMVFETDDSSFCWDGTFNNHSLEVGTYFFYLQAESNCGNIFRKGDITLVK